MTDSADTLQTILSELSPNHLPDDISVLPQALGWWILLFFIIVSIIASIYIYIHKIKPNRYRKIALKRLSSMKVQWKLQKNNSNFIRNLNRLLKQVALTAYPREDVASLYGDPWITFLDKSSNSAQFNQKIGTLFGQMLYSKSLCPANEETSQAFDLVELWIKSHYV